MIMELKNKLYFKDMSSEKLEEVIENNDYLKTYLVDMAVDTEFDFVRVDILEELDLNDYSIDPYSSRGGYITAGKDFLNTLRKVQNDIMILDDEQRKELIEAEILDEKLYFVTELDEQIKIENELQKAISNLENYILESIMDRLDIDDSILSDEFFTDFLNSDGSYILEDDDGNTDYRVRKVIGEQVIF